MSYDIFVQDLPANAITIADIPDDFISRALGPRSAIVDAIRRIAPDVTVDGAWATIDTATGVFRIEDDARDAYERWRAWLARSLARLGL
jgi:hypothetical protein